MVVEVTVTLPEDKYAIVERRAREEGRTISEVVAEYLTEAPAERAVQTARAPKVFDADNLPTDEEIDAMTLEEYTGFVERVTPPKSPPHRNYKEEVGEYLDEKYG